jgi:hypothetical protein
MFKTLPVFVFADQEVSALKSRLAEATIALDRIEDAVVSIDKDAPAEVHALAATILHKVLGSADDIRPKDHGFAHEWEEKAYAAYEASRRQSAGAFNCALGLIAKTKSFYGEQPSERSTAPGSVA